MFCDQCEETIKGGCKVVGVCGKNEEVANSQDKLIQLVIELSEKPTSEKNDDFLIDSLFATITNANFNQEFFNNKIEEGLKLLNKETVGVEDSSAQKTKSSSEIESNQLFIQNEKNEDIQSLKSLILFGLKGIAAYAHHARMLGKKNEEIHDFTRKALNSLKNNVNPDELTALVLECGEVGITAMALLDEANTSTYGNPEPTKVSLEPGNKPGILISGHDLKDLENLLKLTENTEVDVYTHGEMLPANAYPFFKKYANLKGNYGGAWWSQKEEFESFNGPILMTTNCLVAPKKSYKDRLYTTGLVGFEGVKHVTSFESIVEHAKTCVPPNKIEEGSVMNGYAHNTVLGVADKIIDAVKSGAIKRFVVMAGCDGRGKNRSYYTDFAKNLPNDNVILTAGCAKYRYNKLNLGEINGIPRVIDAGQCNDSYSLIVIAQKLAEAFELKDVNELPISFNIAWYEQKAVLVLLSLLHLGVKNIMLGPKLPEFVSEGVLNVLVEKFGMMGNSDVKEDMKKLQITN